MTLSVTRLQLKVVPGASRSEIAGWLGEALRVRVAAPAERGKANAAVLAVLSECLMLPREQVRLVAGGSSQRKVVEITGLELAEIHRRLGGSPH